MLFLSVDHIYGVAVEVKGSATKAVAIGTDSKKVVFTLVLRNTGNTPDEFVLDLYNSDINADGWAVSFTPSTVLLGAGEETEVKVTVYTPSDYPSSPYHQGIIITAKSKGAMAKGQDVRESVTLDLKVEQDVVGYYSTMAALVGIIALIITLIAYFLYRRKKRKEFGGEDKGE